LITLDDVATMSAADEYAAAGAPRYWLVGNDKANTVQLLNLDGAVYELDREVSLSWLLNEPAPALS
jgi:hypothetical protein